MGWTLMVILTALTVVVVLLEHQRTVDERVCRHAIQRTFGVERVEAERILARERDLEP